MAASTPTASQGNRRRKTHNKSRNGCVQCKKRHYKCDEMYPTCSNCKRLETSCSLSTPNSPTDSDIVEKQLNIEDLQLLNDWHMGKKDVAFSDHVAQESFREQRGREIELGFKHPYVLHIILAIAALHMTSSNPSETSKWYPLAISHHSAAIRLARPHIAASNPTHSEAIFNFSAFNSLFSFAEPVLRPDNDGGSETPTTAATTTTTTTTTPRDYLSDLLDSFKMARGIRAIIAKDPSVLIEKGAIDHPGWSYEDHVARIEPTLQTRYPQLSKLSQLASEHLQDGEGQLTATLKALHNLFVNMAVLEESPTDHSSASLIQRWAISIEGPFLSLCDGRHPVALVVLAHYAVLVQMRTNIWFFRRWPRLILGEIGVELRGSPWERWIEEPEREVTRLEEAGSEGLSS